MLKVLNTTNKQKNIEDEMTRKKFHNFWQFYLKTRENFCTLTN